jgi:hypothetical protein
MLHYADETRSTSRTQPQQTGAISAAVSHPAPAAAPSTASSTQDLAKPMAPSALPEFEGKYRYDDVNVFDVQPIHIICNFECTQELIL